MLIIYCNSFVDNNIISKVSSSNIWIVIFSLSQIKSLPYGMEFLYICLCSVYFTWNAYLEAKESFAFQPSQFEQCIIHSLQSLKIVLDCKPGEASVSFDLYFKFPSFYVNYYYMSEQELSKNDTGF